ncbi:TerB family tellurite resistance protein [Aquisalinus flavus]|uniref:Co-chaperone DjlA N-terminal domain-containing protein n=1 Tax=Aquisalinus flavus TaxID=1526572 RepID=A0A8J2Y4U0_9PROT|nr:TerB family tellurite resistance protein [Aquisalinus flavus]MBD0427636.1 TerB family tellurite resistance protein [Aquisalinus flavus]UNE47423.1 hypothetical protein FF099_04775 [Aquisalinus flavus]GGD02566.1 hypothetical protein GCM10011342_09500 [Aquisalinus flavus]
MLSKFFKSVRGFFRPPASEASQMDPHTGLAGLYLETCYRDGGLTNRERAAIDDVLVRQLGLSTDEAMTCRVKAEEIHWTNLTPIGFAMAASKGLDDVAREEVIRTMIRFVGTDNRVDAMENRLIVQTANCFGIASARVKQLRGEVGPDA